MSARGKKGSKRGKPVEQPQEPPAEEVTWHGMKMGTFFYGKLGKIRVCVWKIGIGVIDFNEY